MAVGSFSDDAWGHTYVTVARCRKLVAVGNLATMLGDTITLPSQACGREQLSDDAWGTRLRYHRKLVAVGNLATMFEDTITSRYHRKFVAVGSLATMLGDTLTLPSQDVASLWP